MVRMHPSSNGMYLGSYKALERLEAITECYSYAYPALSNLPRVSIRTHANHKPTINCSKIIQPKSHIIIIMI